jgi:hypothetical protein
MSAARFARTEIAPRTAAMVVAAMGSPCNLLQWK